MLKLEDINKEIEFLEQAEKPSCTVCEQLAWLYIIRDTMSRQARAETKSTVAISPQIVTPSSNGHMTRAIAEKWAATMENADGTIGPHWTFEQTKQIQAQNSIPGNPVVFYAILNSVYSDYCSVADKYGVNNVRFYTDLARAWIEDKDAVENKAEAYYERIVKH